MVTSFLTALLAAALLLSPLSVMAAQLPRCLACHAIHVRGDKNCIVCHRGNPLAERRNIAHSGMIAARYASFSRSPELPESGRLLLEKLGCRRCHVIAGSGNRLAASLDSAAARKDPEALAESIRRPVRNMPDFRMSSEQITVAVTALLAGARLHPQPADKPSIVHFNQADNDSQLFSKKCGSCHRLLTGQAGALGHGDIGPNLSGLLSPYYPRTGKNGQAWSLQGVTQWLKNPREVRPWSQMQPIRLKDSELHELVPLLGTVE